MIGVGILDWLEAGIKKGGDAEREDRQLGR